MKANYLVNYHEHGVAIMDGKLRTETARVLPDGGSGAGLMQKAHLYALAPDMLALLKTADLGEHTPVGEEGPCLCHQCEFRRSVKDIIARADSRFDLPITDHRLHPVYGGGQ